MAETIKITDAQLLFLDNLIYLDLSLFDEEINNLSYIVNYIIGKIEKFVPEDPERLPASMTKEQWVSLLTSFKDNPANAEFLENYVVENYITDDTDADGFRASCFVNKYDKTDVVAVFRGTYGGTEWNDNLMLGNGVSSEIMDRAALYIKNLDPEYGNNITVTGHSKGGNKAQYVTIVTDRIGKCISFDGQGFSQKFLEYYKDVIEEKKSKITSICAEYDFVNAMLTPIAGTSILLFRK